MFRSLLTRSLLLGSLALAAICAPAANAADPGPTGSRVDTSFGADGKVWVSPRNHGAHQEADAVFPAGDGTVYALIAGGRLKKQGNWSPVVKRDHWFLIHYLASGRVDHGFGDHGELRILPWPMVSLPDVTLDSNGRLLVAAYARTKSLTRPDRIFVLRYSKHGRLEKQFGVKGRVVFPYTARNVSPIVSPTIDGGFWFALSSPTGGGTLLKLDAVGAVQSPAISIHGAGRCATSELFDVAPMSDGSAIIACFNEIDSDLTTPYSEVLVRLRPDGSLVNEWATAGRLALDSDPPGATPFATKSSHGGGNLREAPGGGLSLSVFASKGGGFFEWLVRLSADGRYDTTYGIGGSIALGGVPQEGLENNAVVSSALYPQADGSWIISGYSGDDDGSVSADLVSASGKSTNVFGGDTDAFIPGEVNSPPPVPTADGKSLYGFLNTDRSTRRHTKLRALIYRLRLGS